MRRLVLALIPLSVFALGIQECEPEPPSASCDNLWIVLDPDGTTTITNDNAAPVTLDVSIAASLCSNQGCTWIGQHEGHQLGPGETGVYLADQTPEVCTDQFCCDTGYTAHTTAEIFLPAEGCGISVVTIKPTCAEEPSTQRSPL